MATIKYIVDTNNTTHTIADHRVDNLVDSGLSTSGKAADAYETGRLCYAAIMAPLTTSTASGMTDTTRIYIYTGTESGYTSGDKYYYNGSQWVSGGAYYSTSLDIATVSETKTFLDF